MKNPVLAAVLEFSADPERARRYFEALEATAAGPVLKTFSSDQAKILAALFSGSQTLGNLLVAHPDWLGSLDAGRLQFRDGNRGCAMSLPPWSIRRSRRGILRWP